MAIFRYFYDQFQYGFNYRFSTKKEIRERVKLWKESGWPKNVMEICGFMLYERLKREKEALEKYERNTFNRLKRKFG